LSDFVGFLASVALLLVGLYVVVQYILPWLLLIGAIYAVVRTAAFFLFILLCLCAPIVVFVRL
jgi:hypothetical protein